MRAPSHVYGLDLISHTDSGGAQEYHLTDGLGSTTGLADGTGAVTDSYTYDVYGAVRARTGTSGNEFTYTGEQVDATGLQYLRARYYDSATGRFASRDPLPLMQRYAYVGGNPVNYVDPLGLCPGCGWAKQAVGWVGQRGQDAGSVAWHTVTHPGTITNGGIVNQVLGGAIAALSSCDRRSYEGGIVIYENCSGLAAKVTGGRTFTVGSFIFSSTTIRPEVLKPELAHAQQYDAAGASFLLLYGLGGAATAIPCEFDWSCIQSGKNHPLEHLADWQAGTDEY